MDIARISAALFCCAALAGAANADATDRLPSDRGNSIPEWAVPVDASEEYRTYVIFLTVLLQAGQVDGVKSIKARFNVNDIEARQLLDVAGSVKKADAAFQKSNQSLLCARPHDLTTVQTAGKALNRSQDEVHENQVRLVGKALSDLPPDLAAKVKVVAAHANMTSFKGDFTKRLAVGDISPIEAVKQFCDQVALN